MVIFAILGTGAGWRLRSLASAAARLTRALERGYYIENSPVRSSAVVVPRELVDDIRRTVRGKALHVVRDAANGERSFSIQLAVQKAFAKGIIDSGQLKKDRKLAKCENHAEHVSSAAQLLAARPLSGSAVPECWESLTVDPIAEAGELLANADAMHVEHDEPMLTTTENSVSSPTTENSVDPPPSGAETKSCVHVAPQVSLGSRGAVWADVEDDDDEPLAGLPPGSSEVRFPVRLRLDALVPAVPAVEGVPQRLAAPRRGAVSLAPGVWAHADDVKQSGENDRNLECIYGAGDAFDAGSASGVDKVGMLEKKLKELDKNCTRQVKSLMGAYERMAERIAGSIGELSETMRNVIHPGLETWRRSFTR